MRINNHSTDRFACDLCGRDMTYGNDYNENNGEAVVLFYKHGMVPVRFDICPKCFHTKLTPWIVNNAVIGP